MSAISYGKEAGRTAQSSVIVNGEFYADPTKVHPILHEGRYYKVPGIHLCEPSPQRTPVLYQAGASNSGRAFAASNAECVFVSATSKVELKVLRERHSTSSLLIRVGHRTIFLIFNMMTVIIDQTDKLAHQIDGRNTVNIQRMTVRLPCIQAGPVKISANLRTDLVLRKANSKTLQGLGEEHERGRPDQGLDSQRSC